MKFDDGLSHIVDPFLFAFSWERTRTLHYEALTLSDCVQRSGEGKLARQPGKENAWKMSDQDIPTSRHGLDAFNSFPLTLNLTTKVRVALESPAISTMSTLTTISPSTTLLKGSLTP